MLSALGAVGKTLRLRCLEETTLTITTVRARLLASSMISGAALFAAGGALAQAAPTPVGATATPATTPASGSGTTVGEFVVTGSRIPQPNLTSVNPVTQVTSEAIRITGTTKIENLLNNLPQVIAAQGSNLSNGATGTAEVSLRNLGPQRTLVLIDGKRVNAGDPASPYPDLNFIPAQLVSRIEVDTAGASAVYGSDAVAGVVNFIMKRDFEGVQVNVDYGIYQHDNGNSYLQGVNAAKGYTAPSGGIWDGQTVNVSVVMGAATPDGKGNVEGYVGYRYVEPVLQNARDYSNCGLAFKDFARKNFVCSGSGTIPDGQFIIYGNNFATGNSYDLTLDRAHTNPQQFRPRTGADVFNFAPYNYFQRNDQNYTGGFFGHYEINKHADAYAEFMFMDDYTVAQIAPSGIFGQTFTIHCDNPLLSPDQVTKICNDQGITDPHGSNNSVIILKRNVEGGPRQDVLRHTDYRVVLGLKGAIDDNWSYDVYGLWSESIYSERYLNDVSKFRTNEALDVVNGPNGPECRAVLNGTDPTCVPYNIWKIGGVTPQALNFIQTPGFKEGQTTLQVVEGTVTGNLAPYGGKSPWAHDGIGVALGADYQRDSIVLSPDAEFLSGDLAGQGAATPAIDGAYDVKELFAEARVPIVQDMPYAKNVTLDLGYRFSSYSLAGDTNAYEIQGDWAINDDVRIRGGFNQTVRAPNVYELFNPQHLQLDGTQDPCAGAAPGYSQAQCAFTGVSAQQYGHILPNPAAQYNGIEGGNPDLKPETSKTYSVGVVVTPVDLIRGMSFSADYFNISVYNVIQTAGADNTINICATTGNPFYCGLITRAPGTGSLWLGTNGFIKDTNLNLGYVKTSGVDFTFNYQMRFRDFNLPNWGGLALSWIGTYTANYNVQGVLGAPELHCVSKFGPTCQGTGTPQTGPTPAFKGQTRLTWNTPWNGLEASVNWRYIGPSDNDAGIQGAIGGHINAYNYFDLAGQYRFKDRYTLRVGVNNLFDLEPPVISSNARVLASGTVNPLLPGAPFGNGNTFAQVYDALGRYLFMSVTADF